MKLLMCNCQQCKYGRKIKHREMIRKRKTSFRSMVRTLLRKGVEYGLPTKIAIGYTD